MYSLLDSNSEWTAKLIDIRTKVSPLLGSSAQPDLTDHSVDHSDRVVGYVNQLFSESPERLHPEEAYILYAACFLHDVGLHTDNPPWTVALAHEVGSSEAWNGMSREARASVVRRHHHRISAELVLSAVNVSSILGFTLGQDEKPTEIAYLCEAHATEFDEPRYKHLTKDRGRIRMGLLGGILRLADIIDESKKRAPKILLDNLQRPMSSLIHWWRHYYVDDVTINPVNRTIVIVFRYPAESSETSCRGCSC